jgi:hypothetical protein
MSESNGTNGHHLLQGPPPNPEVEAKLEIQRQRRVRHEEVSDMLLATIKDVLAKFPDGRAQLADQLEGFAQSLRAEIEEEKRKERLHGRR